MADHVDDLGTRLAVRGPATRVVSLVPSITEALASVRPQALVGATDWCTHPCPLEVTRVRGTKNPNLGLIRELQPDLVIANQEENRELDVRRLREAGVEVWVTRIEKVPEAVASLERLFIEALGWAGRDSLPNWLVTARRLWCGPLPEVDQIVLIPIWRDPWMVVGSSTFASDLVRRLGMRNVFAEHPDRYPSIDVSELARTAVDEVLLPDEPYPFTAKDGPEAFPHSQTRLVSGRKLTWYGPSLVDAHASLARE